MVQWWSAPGRNCSRITGAILNLLKIPSNAGRLQLLCCNCIPAVAGVSWRTEMSFWRGSQADFWDHLLPLPFLCNQPPKLLGGWAALHFELVHKQIPVEIQKGISKTAYEIVCLWDQFLYKQFLHRLFWCCCHRASLKISTRVINKAWLLILNGCF